MQTNILEKAIALQKEGENQAAINILKSSLHDFPKDKGTLGLLGLILSDNEAYEEAKFYLEQAIKLETQSELVHLGMYISYVKLEEYDKAIITMSNFLDKNRAELFKDTLSELLFDLGNGYATKYESKIKHYAIKNNVPTSIDLETI